MAVVLEVAMVAATVEPMGAALEELTVVVEEVEKEGGRRSGWRWVWRR